MFYCVLAANKVVLVVLDRVPQARQAQRARQARQARQPIRHDNASHANAGHTFRAITSLPHLYIEEDFVAMATTVQNISNRGYYGPSVELP